MMITIKQKGKSDKRGYIDGTTTIYELKDQQPYPILSFTFNNGVKIDPVVFRTTDYDAMTFESQVLCPL